MCATMSHRLDTIFVGQMVILKLLLGPVAVIGASEHPPRLQSAAGRRAAAAPYLWRLAISSLDMHNFWPGMHDFMHACI
jgi:hypothetical protein